MFKVAEDKIEMGLGVHGEAGVGEVPHTTANLAVKQIIDHMTKSGKNIFTKKYYQLNQLFV